jgi:hypothetical protein
MKNYKLLILIFLLLIIVIAGCKSKGSKKKFMETLDKAKTAALARNANVVAQEAARYNLTICSTGQHCTQSGYTCTGYSIATEPGACTTEPILTCICPENTVCLMQASSYYTSYMTGTAKKIYYNYTGSCASAESLTKIEQAFK